MKTQNITNIDKILKLKFVPYGNTIKVDGPPYFTCGHTKVGCYGNRIEACALHFIRA